MRHELSVEFEIFFGVNRSKSIGFRMRYTCIELLKKKKSKTLSHLLKAVSYSDFTNNFIGSPNT